MPVTLLCMLCVLSALVPTVATSDTIVTIPILQMRTLRLRNQTQTKLWSLDLKQVDRVQDLDDPNFY